MMNQASITQSLSLLYLQAQTIISYNKVTPLNINSTLLSLMLSLLDPHQGLSDGVCECHHVLQGETLLFSKIPF